jgi:lysozyme
MMHSIEDQLILHEGLRLKPYRCTAGKLTIGVGRNLEDKGITHDEAMILLCNDIKEITGQLERHSWYVALGPVRRKVLIDMAFNLGMAGLMGFKQMIEALKRADYERAADEMVNSRWYRQVGERGRRLERMMRTGEDYQV